MTVAGARVLVTGGAGFVGSHLVDRLLAEGARVRVLDNLLTGDERNVDAGAEFIRGDVRDPEAVARAVRGAEIIFHEAAQINPARAVEDPLFDFEINVLGTLRLLQAAVRAGVRRFVFASTNLYGDADVPIAREDVSVLSLRRALLSPYAAAKAAAEAYIKVFTDEYGLPGVRLRYTNVYGPRQLTKSESGVIAIFARNALHGRPLVVFGDGQQTRDFVYIDDVVQANVLAATRDEVAGMVFNVGTGYETSVRELAELLRRITRAEVPIHTGPARAADFRRVRVDLSESRRVLGFVPTVPLEDGLARYVAWCRQNPARL